MKSEGFKACKMKILLTEEILTRRSKNNNRNSNRSSRNVSPSSANPTNGQTQSNNSSSLFNCSNAFDNFVGLALKGLK